MDHGNTLYARSRYSVVAVDDDAGGEHILGIDQGFAVITTAGVSIHYESSFEAARDWVDRRVGDEIAQAEPATCEQAARRRRC